MKGPWLRTVSVRMFFPTRGEGSEIGEIGQVLSGEMRKVIFSPREETIQSGEALQV